MTICPVYEGSVKISWYPVIAVLKTTSPERSAGAPKLLPSKTVPSSRARIAESNNFLLGDWGKNHCTLPRLAVRFALKKKAPDADRTRCRTVFSDRSDLFVRSENRHERKRYRRHRRITVGLVDVIEERHARYIAARFQT